MAQIESYSYSKFNSIRIKAIKKKKKKKKKKKELGEGRVK